MKREQHPAVESLRWFLDFMNASLDDASEEEVYRRLFEASYRFVWTPEGSSAVNVPAPAEVRNAYSARQGRRALKILQAGLRDFLDAAVSKKTASMGSYALSMTRNTKTGRWLLATRIPRAGKSQARTVWLPAARAMLAFVLHDLPEGLPREPIGRCEECGGLFLRVSGKPKVYCTARCTSVALARKRRGKPGSRDREKYNREMRELMRRRYREKVLGK